MDSWQFTPILGLAILVSDHKPRFFSDLKPREKEVTLNGLIQNTFVDLVGGIPTPLKNDGVRQLG